MRKTKSLLALLCAVVAAFVLAVPAFAAPNSHTLTIHSDTGGHTYEAFQVFKGDISSDGTTLSNIQWGDNISDGNLLVDALVTNNDQFDPDFTDDMTAAQVAEMLEDMVDNSAELDEFAAIVGGDGAETGSGFLKGAPATSTGTGSGTNWTYTITDLAPGYYLVRDAATSPTDPTSTKTKFMLEVIADVTAEAKDDTIPVDKDITNVDGTQPGNPDYADAAIGDVVTFDIETTVPQMDGYNYFKFIIQDTLSAGLTYNPGSLTVTRTRNGDDTQTLTANTDYTLVAPTSEPTENEESSLSVTFIDILHSATIDPGDVIHVTYTATIDDDAVIGNVGNPNSANIVFSNDPNYTYDGTPGFSDDEPRGTTPDSKVHLYVTGLQLKKVDEKDGPLSGAQFMITGETLNTTVVVGYDFVMHEGDGKGEYYKLTNGTYTTDAPNPDGSEDSYYESTTTTYDRMEYANTIINADEDPDFHVTAWVDEDGILRVNGLKAGTYTITEVTAPDGYNKIEDINFTVNWAAPANPATSTDCTWTVTDVTEGNQVTVAPGPDPIAGTILLTIRNLPGATLPSTGGIGTTIFYAVGATLVIGAGVVLVSRYRANHMK